MSSGCIPQMLSTKSGLQRLAHGAVGMCGLRLDARADDVTDKAVHRRRDPGVVAGIPFCASGCRGSTSQDRRVQTVDRARAVPAAATACCVKCLSKPVMKS